MTQEQCDVRFQDADGTIRFATPEMVDIFRRVVHGWPLSEKNDTFSAFAEVRATQTRWVIEFPWPDKQKTRKHDPINAICDLIVELNWSRLRQNNELMCLHAAGLQMGNSLLVLPSRRRAGKSTLSAELARRGHHVFTDDILAVQLNSSGVADGLATGVAPRLRLPLPAGASPAFSRWVEKDPGPANAQYKYLTSAPVAEYGQACPIGGIVTLERVEDDIDPVFSEIDIGEILPILIYQNFGRFANAQRILSVFSAIAQELPCLKLTYGNFERAADLLEASVDEGLLTKGAIARTDHAPLPDFSASKAPFDPSKAYRRRPGFKCVETGNEAFISDASGIGIFRLGPGMMPIWVLLEEPATVAEVTSILTEVFPETDRETLYRDTRKAFSKLNGSGLIEAVHE